MPYFKSHDAILYFESVGNGPALVFIPPPALGTDVFLQQKEALSSHFQVITFDPPGNNNSPDSEKNDYTIQDWSEDIAFLMKHLDLEEIILCGYSLGGGAAQEFTLRYPEKTKALVLICTFPEVSSMFLSAKFKTGQLLTWLRVKKLLGAGLAVSHTNRSDNKKYLYRAIQKSNAEIVHNMYKNGEKYNVTNELSRIKCPVTYIYSGLDLVALPYVKMYKENIPQLTLVKIAELTAMHQLPTRAASQVNSIIRSLHSNTAGNSKHS